ncbi:MAG: hypothetical protein IT538_14960, partial [Variibacter sp.]|nr:hypothetical protein [Variibacter sp.]
MTDFTRSTPLSLLRAWFDRARLYVRALFVRSVPLERFAHRGRAHDDHHRDDHHDEHLLEHAPAHAHHHLLRSCGPRRWPKVVLCLGVAGGIAAVVCGGLWWRLGEGPIAFDVATPWLTSALAEKFGAGHAVEVGGTVIERDENGRTAIRLRDVVVRDANGEIVASAPKADVGIATGSLLTGRVRTERLSLIGAEMALRIERDGQISVFAAGAGDRPLASIAAVGAAPVSGSGQPASAQDASPAADLPAPNLFTTVLGWLQSLDAAGFDGRDLSEIGLRGGSISVDDRRTGKRLTFDNINLSLTRLRDGGIALGVNSAGTDGPWSLNATVTPMADGFRMVDAVIRDVSPKDVMLALRLGNGELAADVPLSAAVRAELGPDGMPRALQGRIVGGA